MHEDEQHEALLREIRQEIARLEAAARRAHRFSVWAGCFSSLWGLGWGLFAVSRLLSGDLPLWLGAVYAAAALIHAAILAALLSMYRAGMFARPLP